MAAINPLLIAVFLILFQGYEGSYWPCESNDDCSAEGSQCSLDVGLCECLDFESVLSEDYSKCLKTSQFGDTCVDTFQCNLMPSGARCKAGVCDCVEGQTFVRGRCRTLNGLGESCDTDFDCYFGYDRQSVVCKNQVCDCANGYYQRYGNICRRRSMEIEDACVVDTDCSELGTKVRCVDLVCKSVDEINKKDSSSTLGTTKTRTETSEATSEPSKIGTGKNTPVLVNGRVEFHDAATETQEQQKSTVREIAIQTSIDSFELKPLPPKYKNAATDTGSPSFNNRRLSQHKRRQSTFRTYDEDKTLSTLSNTDDELDDRNYGSTCTENAKPCSGLPHSICSNNMCLCKQGYYNKNKKCFAELGEIAESADECEHTFDEVSKKCICQKNFYYDRHLRSCRKPIPFHLSCTSNNQCSPFGAVFCHPEIPRRCTCVEYAEYDELQQLCVYKQGLGAECENNEGCTVGNSVCSNRYCVCKENYIEKDGACAPGIGASCDIDTDCNQENSICEATTSNSEERLKSCQCRKGFVHFKDECIKEAEEIEDECVDTEQCKPLLATCIEKKCTCTAEQHFKYGRCMEKKSLDDACNSVGECFVEKDPENVECRNSVCQCKFGYQANAERKTCTHVTNKKNSSGRPSALKIITFLLIGSAFLITSAAIKQAYY